MSLTLITNEVIQTSSIGPDNLSFGAPRWSTSGILSATKFIGDGSGLTNVFPGLSVVEVTESFFQITPDHNNAVLALNNSSDILLDLDFIGTFVEGHKTTLVQVNQGKGIIGFPTYNSSGYDRTRGIYSVGTLLYGGFSNGWTLYGDLTAQVLPDTSGNDGRATQLAAINQYSLVLGGNGLYVTGRNLYGQLGTGDTITRSTFTRLSGAWDYLKGNGSSTYALSSGDLYACGNNNVGQLGFGDTVDRSIFTKVTVPANAKWSSIAAGASNFYALSGTDLYAVGNNNLGNLGLGDTNFRSTLTKVVGKWSGVAADSNHTFLLSGTDLYGSGLNLQGQLGLGDAIHRSTFTKVPGNWTNVTVGSVHTIALSSGDLYAVGYNFNGELGLGDRIHRSTFTKVPDNWTAIEAANEGTFALSGTDLYGTGWNDYGNLGLGYTTRVSTFTKVPGNWSAISAGIYETLALSATGNGLFSTGYNNNGQLGLGDTVNRSTFTRVSGVYIEYSAPVLPQFTQIAASPAGFYSLALSGTDLYGTGYNLYGGLGLRDLAFKSTFTKVTVPTNAKWTAIAAGSYHSLALSGTDLYATGHNFYGPLGSNTTNHGSTFAKVSIPANAKWTAIAAGFYHSFALSGTDLYSCGYNEYGGLGINSATHRSTFTKINGNWTAIAVGNVHSLALSGTDLYCTGRNDNGELGLGDLAHRSTFTKINGNWTAIAVGNVHSLALSGTDLYSCGWNNAGQLGHNNINSKSTFTKVTIPVNAKWTDIAAGANVSFALSGNNLYIVGENTTGQLGIGNTFSQSTFTKIPGSLLSASGGFNFSTALSSSQTLYGTGRNDLGQLGLNDRTNRSTFTQVTAVG